jgi:hypothetical protein
MKAGKNNNINSSVILDNMPNSRLNDKKKVFAVAAALFLAGFVAGFYLIGKPTTRYMISVKDISFSNIKDCSLISSESGLSKCVFGLALAERDIKYCSAINGSKLNAVLKRACSAMFLGSSEMCLQDLGDFTPLCLIDVDLAKKACAEAGSE